MITVGSFFCGMGGFCEGFNKKDFKTIWANDFDKDVAKTYRLNFPSVRYLHEDIKKIPIDSLNPVSVIHGGFPCQSFSSAGARSGFNDAKGRGKLFDVMMDKIEALQQMPLVLVFENVPNLKIGENGLWFQHVKKRIKSAGYWFGDENALIIDTRKNGGLPQRRERLFMIAVRKDICDFNPFNKIEEEKEIKKLDVILKSLENKETPIYLNSESKYHEEMWEAGVVTGDLSKPYQLIQYRKYRPRIIEPGICPTLTQNMGAGGHNIPFYLDTKDQKFRKLSVMQCMALQGFRSDYKFPEEISAGAKYRMIGNAVSPAVSEIIANMVQQFLESINDKYKMAF